LAEQCGAALRVFDQALEHFPEDAVLHFNRAVALDTMGRLDEARSALSSAWR